MHNPPQLAQPYTFSTNVWSPAQLAQPEAYDLLSVYNCCGTNCCLKLIDVITEKDLYICLS